MAEHHPFGEAGGATGVEDAQQGVALAPCILHRSVGTDQGFIVEHARRGLAVTGIDQGVYALGGSADLCRQGGKGIIDDQDAGL
ncbi:hypothetical protein D3C80_1754370 [compost metagenome]